MRLINFFVISIIGLFQIVISASNGYTKEVLTVNVTDNKNKLYTVEGSTCNIEMQYFDASANSEYFKGNTAKGSSTVIKRFKDGRIESRARYILKGTDSSNNSCTIFIEDNMIGYDDNNRPITKPTIITSNNKLSWLQTADLQGIVEDKGNGSKIIHIMWNESNKSKIPYPTVQVPDQSRNYNKELFTFDISVGGDGFESVPGADQALGMFIGFSCSSNTKTFKGKGLDNFVDTRMQFKNQAQTLSARYIIEGTDDDGRKCKVYIENNGIDVNGINTEPFIVTDNPKWAWIERAPLHGDSTMTNGFQIHLYTVNDPSLWENPQINDPIPETPINNQCSSKITAQGYSCCSSSNCSIIYTDEDGTWGVENGQWCGCGNEPVHTCSSNFTSQGYSCCSKCSKVYYVDNDGNWGIENGEWCGMPSNC
ncbi:hypothetical protein BCR36DRAFT_579411 [Piromyces finnis]|uniref:CBM10 domain-containing protein n=1 Tax=Piromyces finnis TaxID=1754191 RepID=A0A1Y1VMF4_9FUNG|nr:hypothetical protein BCR36DRAFT_579411 [Piromyces finnis]|eukprot:ORX59959.1 hypothetical protein BCR36DRAFT_579411 [Piromyces finnis]